MTTRKPHPVGGILLCACLPTLSTPVACGFSAALFLGWLDDVLDLKPWIKLIVETAIGYSVTQDIYATMWIVFFMNAMNLSDNMDGLATGVGIVAAIFMGQPVLVGALGIFLLFNFPKAKIYLGDCGSLSLGFLLAMLVWETPMNYTYVMIPILDTIYVSCNRIRLGTSPFKGGKDHLSHMLALRMGETQAVVALWLCAIGFALI